MPAGHAKYIPGKIFEHFFGFPKRGLYVYHPIFGVKVGDEGVKLCVSSEWSHRNYIIILILTTLVSCSGKEIKNNDAIYSNEFYSVLNDLIQIRLTDVSVIKFETRPVFKTRWGNSPIPKGIISPLHHPPIEVLYCDSIFLVLKLKENYWILLMQDSCFISVSTPIFNSNYTKAILFIDYCCGPVWGEGYKFLLEKKNGKFKLNCKFNLAGGKTKVSNTSILFFFAIAKNRMSDRLFPEYVIASSFRFIIENCLRMSKFLFFFEIMIYLGTL